MTYALTATPMIAKVADGKDTYIPFFQSESLPFFRRMVSEPSELVRS
jgi:hypothetical protein